VDFVFNDAAKRVARSIFATLAAKTHPDLFSFQRPKISLPVDMDGENFLPFVLKAESSCFSREKGGGIPFSKLK